MSFYLFQPDEIVQHQNFRIYESHQAWICTAGSHIFFMQLGFLLYECSFVHRLLVPSIILKNIADFFISVVTFVAFGWHISQFGFHFDTNQLFLIDTPTSDHQHVFVSIVFAATCSTIISGSVLERMQTKAYLLYVMFTVLVNYSWCAYWVWSSHGFLHNLGFVDSAGATVVHMVGGTASLVAVWQLGPRRGSGAYGGKNTQKPISTAMGAMILGFTWHAFNLSSPISAEKQLGDVIGSIGLITGVAPCFSVLAAALLMRVGFIVASFNDLIGCFLAGLVSITAANSSVSLWEASFIGLFAAPLYLTSCYLIQNKLKLDDPVQVISVHLVCGVYSCFVEGVFANATYGDDHIGLLRGGVQHFGVQCLGIVCVFAFNFVSSYLIWIAMKKTVFRHSEMRTGMLDTYLGQDLFVLNYDWAMEDVLNCASTLSKQILFLFHVYCADMFADEQLDFLVAITIFRDLIAMTDMGVESNQIEVAKHALSIIGTYVQPDGLMCANFEATYRAHLLRFAKKLKKELQQRTSSSPEAITDIDDDAGASPQEIDVLAGNYHQTFASLDIHPLTLTSASSESRSSVSANAAFSMLQDPNLFRDAFLSVYSMMLPIFIRFLSSFNRKKDVKHVCVGLPFSVEADWMLRWDTKLQVVTSYEQRLGTTAPTHFAHHSARVVSEDPLQIRQTPSNTKEKQMAQSDHPAQIAAGNRIHVEVIIH